VSRQAGFKHSPETKAKMSAAQKGRAVSPETRAKIGAANRGRKFSDESRAKMGASHSGEKSYLWKGGRHLTKNGYVRLSLSGKTRCEHIVVAERALGRSLRPGEMVHHINGNKQDNRNCNLLICTGSYHKQLEARMVRLYQSEHFGQG